MTSGTPTERNILGTTGGVNYYATGISSPAGISRDVIIPYPNDDNAAAGMQHLQPFMPPYASFDIRVGSPFSDYLTPAPDEKDQLGDARIAPYALGAVGRSDISLKENISPVIFIVQGGVVTTPVKALNLNDYVINLPVGGSASFSGGAIIAGLGSVVVNSGGSATITTDPGITSGHYNFTFTATSGSKSKQGIIPIYVVEDNLDREFPGYLDPGDITACFDYMGNVSFTSRLMYRTDQTCAPYTHQQARIAWSSTPTVGDLNHDGFPEIIALAINNSSTEGGHWSGVIIHDGRTGKIVSRLDFKNAGGTGAAMSFTHYAYHSATPFVLVDSDRDGTVEMIMAFPNGSTNGAAYVNRLVSYKIVWDVLSGTYSLVENPKWTLGWPKYNDNISASTPSGTATTFHKAVPQVFDLLGGGAPQVLVYNKIYNAVNGSVAGELELLGANLATTTAYMGINPNAAEVEDRSVSFPAVYDIDLDGEYEVIAGGKIYKRPNSGYVFDIIQAPGGAASIGDGYTAVADVDGDGLPDIVVARQNGSNIVVTVWNPAKGIIASRTVTVSGLSEGSLSYVF